MVQLREKQVPAGQLLGLAVSLRDLTQGRALLFVNDRVDVALACGADGVQLGENGLPPAAARAAGAGRLLIGRSVHSVEGAIDAEAEGADLLIVGTIFPTRSHRDGHHTGVRLLEEVGRRVGIPYLAIGGVDEHNVASVIGAGASGAAMISAISLDADPAEAARRLLAAAESEWASSHGKSAARPA